MVCAIQEVLMVCYPYAQLTAVHLSHSLLRTCQPRTVYHYHPERLAYHDGCN